MKQHGQLDAPSVVLPLEGDEHRFTARRPMSWSAAGTSYGHPVQPNKCTAPSSTPPLSWGTDGLLRLSAAFAECRLSTANAEYRLSTVSGDSQLVTSTGTAAKAGPSPQGQPLRDHRERATSLLRPRATKWFTLCCLEAVATRPSGVEAVLTRDGRLVDSVPFPFLFAAVHPR